MRIPSELLAGDSKTWLDDPTSDGDTAIDSTWTLVYSLRGKNSLNLTASTSGSGWSTSITAAQSAALTPGVYYWQARATKASAAITIGTGRIEIKANLAAAGDDFDGRSQTVKDLEAVQAAMRAIIAKKGVAEYTIASRSLRTYAFTELIALESKLKADVVREQKAEKMRNGEGNPHNLYVRFKK